MRRSSLPAVDVPPTGGQLWFDRALGAWRVSGRQAAYEIYRRTTEFSLEGYQGLGDDSSDLLHFLLAPAEQHRLLRRFMIQAFAARRMEELQQDDLCPVAGELVAALPPGGRVDLIDRLVRPYTVRVYSRIIGVPVEVTERLGAAFRVLRSLYQAGDAARLSAAQAFLRDALDDACEPNDGAGPRSLLGRFYDGGWHERGLTRRDLRCVVTSLFEAAGCKTDSDVSASLVSRLCGLPQAEQMRLMSEGRLMEAAREAVRLQRGGFIPRRAACEVELAGARIRTGDLVLIMLGEVGRDPAEFAEPDHFDPWRSPARHDIEFGGGKHRCVGEPLALTVAVALAEALLVRFLLHPGDGAVESGRLIVRLHLRHEA